MVRLLFEQLLKFPKSILLLGPRQVGKSTLLKQLKPDLNLNLANESTYLELLSNPQLLENMIRAKNPRIVFIDEIQRIPQLLNTIQSIIDDHKNPPRFLISGSSARKLKRGNANLLPGRVLDYRLSGLSCLELNENWNVERAMQLGCLPEPYLSQDDEFAQKLLETYSGIYLKEEIQMEAEKINLAGFSRFLIKSAEHSGNILDFTKIANKSKISRTSAKRYYEILEDSLVVYRCSPYETINKSMKFVKHPKFYIFDPGVWNGFLKNYTVSVDRKGKLFEHLVIAQLYNASYTTDIPIEVFWLRNQNGIEIDFIVKFLRSEKYFAIEVKSGEFSSADLKALLWLNGFDEKISKSFLIYPSVVEQKIKNITVTTLEKLIAEIFKK